MAVVVLSASRNRRVTSEIPADGGVQAAVNTEETSEVGATAGVAEQSVAQADPVWFVIGAALCVVGIYLGYRLFNHYDKVVFEAKAGFNEFAVLYIMAQSIERIAEFISYIPGVGIRIGSHRTTISGSTQTLTKEDAANKRDQAMVQGIQLLGNSTANGNPRKADFSDGDTAATAKATVAADAQHTLDVIRSNRAIAFFGLNTFLAALGAGYFHLLILNAIGVTGASEWLDIAVTALAIGGGTKPLHDLIGNIQKAKEQKEDGTTAVAA